jgi:type IV pilus assembly protein PilP
MNTLPSPLQKSCAHRTLRLILGAGVLLMLNACVDKDKSDLERFVNEIKAQKTVHIGELPEFPTDRIYIYPTGNRPDPFQSFVAAPTNTPRETAGEDFSQRKKACIRPDIHRNKEALEQFPLDALSMVGTLSPDGEGVYGLIVDQAGLIYRVELGNYMGQNHGRIIAIEDDRIELMELINDGTGCYIDRESSVKSQK